MNGKDVEETLQALGTLDALFLVNSGDPDFFGELLATKMILIQNIEEETGSRPQWTPTGYVLPPPRRGGR